MNEINILYCGNDNIFDGLMISIMSIIKHCKEKINIYIMTMDLSDIKPSYTALTKEHADYLREILLSANVESTLTLLDLREPFLKEMKDSPNMATKYTPYAMLRLFADDLACIPDKVLYLDGSDIVLNRDVSLVYNLDVDGYEFAAASDYLGKTFIAKDYFNSGVLVLNMKKIRETQLFHRARALLNVKRLEYPDQDALYRLVKYRYTMPSIYNKQDKLTPDTVVKHFSKTLKFPFRVINIKPWQVDKVRNKLKIHEFDDILDEYLARKKALDSPKDNM